MPTIAEFNGITIRIYYRPREHPPPHFHAICGDQQASFDIHTLEVIAGNLRRAQRRAVTGWAESRREQLMTCWNLAMAGRHPGSIS
jgi:Domain of unknown function (DUF4160)